MNKFKSKEHDNLFNAILTLQNVEECYQFFLDVCTICELQSMSQRFEVATMLYEKKTYHEISKTTKASSATISRVNRTLHFGQDGYHTVFLRFKEKP